MAIHFIIQHKVHTGCTWAGGSGSGQGGFMIGAFLKGHILIPDFEGVT
jgi:hypothetical protein